MIDGGAQGIGIIAALIIVDAVDELIGIGHPRPSDRQCQAKIFTTAGSRQQGGIVKTGVDAGTRGNPCAAHRHGAGIKAAEGERKRILNTSHQQRHAQQHRPFFHKPSLI